MKPRPRRAAMRAVIAQTWKQVEAISTCIGVLADGREYAPTRVHRRLTRMDRRLRKFVARLEYELEQLDGPPSETPGS